jgi:hypothetical protein
MTGHHDDNVRRPLPSLRLPLPKAECVRNPVTAVVRTMAGQPRPCRRRSNARGRATSPREPLIHEVTVTVDAPLTRTRMRSGSGVDVDRNLNALRASGREAAVCDDCLTGDVSVGLARQENHEACDVLRFPQSSGRGAADDLLQLLLIESV